MQQNHKSVYRTRVRTPTKKVWETLTNAEIIELYFFGSEQTTDWKVGNPIVWTGEYEGTA